MYRRDWRTLLRMQAEQAQSTRKPSLIELISRAVKLLDEQP